MSTTLKGAPAPRPADPTDQQLVDFLQRTAVFEETVRYQQLDRYEAFWRAQQYRHQEYDWWGRNADAAETISPGAVYPAGYQASGGKSELLTRDKRPTAPTNKGRTIVRRYTSLLFSEHRRPRVVVDQDPDTDAFLDAVREASKFWHAMRSARNLGGAMGSVCMTVHLRNGKFAYEVHNPKHCTPIWADRRTWKLAGLLVMYRYPRTENDYDEKGNYQGTKEVMYLYRRIITPNVDVVYKEIKVDDAMEAGWEPDPALAVEHGLGFFPGVWIQNSAESTDMDGEPDCTGAFQTIDTNDRLLAQMHYGTNANIDPTVVLAYDAKAVEAGGGLGGAVQKGSDNAVFVGQGGSAAYMEISGAGVDAGLKLSDRLERNISEMTGAVFLDDSDLASAQSARAIEYRFEPMLEVADDLRAQYGEPIVELMRLTERMARKFQDATVQLPEGRVGKFRFDLPPRKSRVEKAGKVLDVIADHKLGPGGYVDLHWGPYFPPTEDDNQKVISNSAAANAAGFVPKAEAARRVAPIFNIQDVEGAVAKAEEEREKDAALGLAGLDAGLLPDDDHGERRVAPAGQGGKP